MMVMIQLLSNDQMVRFAPREKRMRTWQLKYFRKSAERWEGSWGV